MTTTSSRARRALIASLAALILGMTAAPPVSATTVGSYVRITVEAVDGSGAPVVGAVVHFLTRSFYGVELLPVAVVSTDASGRATGRVWSGAESTFAVVPPVDSGLGAVVRGGGSPYGGDPHAWDVMAPPVADVTERIVVPAEIVLEGNLSVDGGEPVPETEVYVASGGVRPRDAGRGPTVGMTHILLPRATTDESGRYRFEGLVPGQGMTLWVRDEAVSKWHDTFPQFRGGGVSRPVPSGAFDLPASGVVDFDMVPGAWFTGQVSDATGPRAGVRIVPRPVAAPEAEVSGLTGWTEPWIGSYFETDSDGRFRVGPVAQGARYLLRLIPPDESPAYVQDILGRGITPIAFGDDAWLTAARETVLDLELRSAHVYEGRAVDEQGVPHEGATVEWASGLSDGTRTTTAADGRFRIKAVPGWDAPVFVYVPRPPSWYREYLVGGFGAAGAADEPGAEPVDVGDVVVPRSITLQGRIVDAHDGGPASGWSVQVESWSDESGGWTWVAGPLAVTEDGTFKAFGLRPGTRHSVVLRALAGSGNYPYQRMSLPGLTAPATDGSGEGFMVPVVPVGDDGRLTYVLEEPIVAHRLASLDVSVPASIGTRAVEVCARTTSGTVVSGCVTLEDGQLETRLLADVVPGTPYEVSLTPLRPAGPTVRLATGVATIDGRIAVPLSLVPQWPVEEPEAPSPRPSTSPPPTAAPRDPAPVFSAAPAVTGAVKVGGTLAVRENIVGRGVHVRYQWIRNGKVIPRATAAAFKVRKSDVGSRLAVRLTATRGSSTATVRTSRATKVVPRMVPTLAVARTTKVTSRTVKVRVDVRRAGQLRVAGKVRVRIGTVSRTATVRHSAGRSYVVVTMPRLARGKHRATVSYAPSTAAGKYFRSVTKRVTITQR